MCNHPLSQEKYPNGSFSGKDKIYMSWGLSKKNDNVIIENMENGHENGSTKNGMLNIIQNAYREDRNVRNNLEFLLFFLCSLWNHNSDVSKYLFGPSVI